MKGKAEKGIFGRYIDAQVQDVKRLRQNLLDGRNALLEQNYRHLSTDELEREVTIFRRARNGVVALATMIEGEAVWLGIAASSLPDHKTWGGLTVGATIIVGGAVYCEVGRRRRNKELKRRSVASTKTPPESAQ